MEAAYIELGGLHHYELGWFFGVPLWIALWWALGAWLWADLSARIHRALLGWRAPSRARAELRGLGPE